MFENYPLAPMLAIRGAAKAVDWYTDIFGAEELPDRFEDADGRIGHTAIRVRGALIMIADEYPEHNTAPDSIGATTVMLHLYVDDVDATIARAIEAGALLVRAAADLPQGDRAGKIKDPFGHVWFLATPLK